MSKYQQTIGYFVYAHTTPNGMQYIGMSKMQPSQRWKKSKYKDTILAPYIEQYGWQNIEHKVLLDGLTKKDAEQWEDRLIMALSMNGLCINKQRSGGICRDNKQAYMKQYNEDHKEERKQYMKQWCEEHKEEIKQYNEDHKEERKQYMKQWYEENKEERKAYDKQYNKQRNSTPEGKIYNRVKNYNQRHTPIETPMMAKLNYIMLGIVPWYIKNDDLCKS